MRYRYLREDTSSAIVETLEDMDHHVSRAFVALPFASFMWSASAKVLISLEIALFVHNGQSPYSSKMRKISDKFSILGTET